MPTLSAKKWAELKYGWGLEEVPKEMRQGMVCVMCHAIWPGKLYTTAPTTSNDCYTRQGYEKLLGDIAAKCYCRYHTEWYFAEREES